MALDARGRIVLVGLIWIREDGLPSVEVMRLTATGSLDRSFSRDGRRRVRLGAGGNVADAIAIQSDGRIVIVGHRYAYSNTGTAIMSIVRLLPGGRLDRSFGREGHKEIDIPYSLEDAAESVVIQDDGKILVGGEADDWGVLVRLHANGRVDRTFGAQGRVLTAPDGSRFTALALQRNDRILGATQRLVRYLPDGTPDSSFGEAGVAVNPPGAHMWGCSDIALQVDRKIVCSSYIINYEPESNSHDAAVLRWKPRGVPDAGFGSNGVVITGVEPSPGPESSGSQEEAYGVMVQPDGKIVTAGFTYSYATSGPYVRDSFLVIRYLSSGALDTSFGEKGIVRTQFTGFIESAEADAFRSNRIVVGGTANDSDMAVTRYVP